MSKLSASSRYGETPYHPSNSKFPKRELGQKRFSAHFRFKQHTSCNMKKREMWHFVTLVYQHINYAVVILTLHLFQGNFL